MGVVSFISSASIDPMICTLKIEPKEGKPWEVRADVDSGFCNATVDFNVPGNPDPPPVDLTVSIKFLMDTFGAFQYLMEFTDPTGALGPGPVNQWAAPVVL